MNTRIQELKLQSVTNSSEIITEADIQKLEIEIKENKSKIKDYEKTIKNSNININNADAKLEKIESIRKQFPIKELKERNAAQLELEKTLLVLEGSLDQENSILKNKQDSISLLDQVPCWDEFPTCKFIKRSHQDKELISGQLDTIEDISEKIKAAKKSFEILLKEDLKCLLYGPGVRSYHRLQCLTMW